MVRCEHFAAQYRYLIQTAAQSFTGTKAGASWSELPLSTMNLLTEHIYIARSGHFQVSVLTAFDLAESSFEWVSSALHHGYHTFPNATHAAMPCVTRSPCMKHFVQFFTVHLYMHASGHSHSDKHHYTILHIHALYTLRDVTLICLSSRCREVTLLQHGISLHGKRCSMSTFIRQVNECTHVHPFWRICKLWMFRHDVATHTHIYIYIGIVCSRVLHWTKFLSPKQP